MSDHISELIPWHLNGRLSSEDKLRVVQHLQHCKQCNAELNMQRHIHAAITTSGKIEIAPQPSFNKLWERIVTDDICQDNVIKQVHQPQPRSFSQVQNLMNWLRLHWMPFMLITQTAAIVVLAGVLTLQQMKQGDKSAIYHTVTSSTPMSGIVIHAVFDDATRLGDIKDILLHFNLQVTSGPTPAGVYSLSPTNNRADFNPREAVQSLREDPRVRFAEVAHE